MLEIGILASEKSWYFRDLERAATARGMTCQRLDFERIVATVGTKSATILCRASEPCEFGPSAKPPNANHSVPITPETIKPLSGDPDLILVRTMPPGSLEQVVYRMDALARWEAMGKRVVNSPKSLECAVDKYLTTAKLQSAGLPVPETVVCEHEDDAMDAFAQLGGDVVVKPLFGAEGRGIVRVSDIDLAHRTFRTLARLSSVLYLQKFVDHGGFDVRILVLNGRIVGGMKRCSPNDFRTNVSREAVADRHEPTPMEIEYALRATEVTGAFIAGIDLLYDRRGACYVIEVNAVPGWQAFSRVNQIDVASLLIHTLT